MIVKILYSRFVTDYNRAKSLTTEATTLAQQILDARLALTRLRQAHPHPRLTVATASAHLEAQVIQMQEFDEKVQDVNDRVASVKEKVKEGAREVERLRVKRAEVEKGVKTAEVEVEDGRVIGLYDW
jgi:chromosome segregation ATPase